MEYPADIIRSQPLIQNCNLPHSKSNKNSPFDRFTGDFYLLFITLAYINSKMFSGGVIKLAGAALVVGALTSSAPINSSLLSTSLKVSTRDTPEKPTVITEKRGNIPSLPGTSVNLGPLGWQASSALGTAGAGANGVGASGPLGGYNVGPNGVSIHVP